MDSVVAMNNSLRTQENSSTVVGPLRLSFARESEICRVDAPMMASSPGPGDRAGCVDGTKVDDVNTLARHAQGVDWEAILVSNHGTYL